MNNIEDIIMKDIRLNRVEKLDYQTMKYIMKNFSEGTVVIVSGHGAFLVNNLGLTPVSSCNEIIKFDENGFYRPETREEKIERFDKIIAYYEFLKRNV